jgi:hypothetical protein
MSYYRAAKFETWRTRDSSLILRLGKLNNELINRLDSFYAFRPKIHEQIDNVYFMSVNLFAWTSA